MERENYEFLSGKAFPASLCLNEIAIGIVEDEDGKERVISLFENFEKFFEDFGLSYLTTVIHDGIKTDIFMDKNGDSFLAIDYKNILLEYFIMLGGKKHKLVYTACEILNLETYSDQSSESEKIDLLKIAINSYEKNTFPKILEKMAEELKKDFEKRFEYKLL